jgi:nucleoside-diphosphate-sugar epimerase
VCKTLVLGTGRIGKSASEALTSNGNKVVNISSQLALNELKQFFLENRNFMDVIVWCGRDAGLPTNSNNSSAQFYLLLEMINEFNWVGKVVYLSSAGEIYGSKKNHLWKEEDIPYPITPYGCLKLKHENMLLKLEEAGFLKVLILRVTNVYEFSEIDSGFVGALLQSILNGTPLSLKQGGQTRDFINLADVTNILSALMNLGETGILNVGTGLSFSLNSVIKEFKDTLRKDINISHTNELIAIPESRVSISKLEAKLGWRPRDIISLLNENDFTKSMEF